jgi:peptide/nickel transport system substrate-binding protein
VRKAIAHAINEDEIIEKVMRGQATAGPSAGRAHRRVPARVEAAALRSGKSKKLLAEAGYPNGFDITVAGPNDRYVNDEKICEAVAKYLAKVGLKVTLDVKPKSIFFDELSDYKHRFYLIGWFDGSFDFGRSAEKLLHTPDKDKGMGAYNGAVYSNPEIDAK